MPPDSVAAHPSAWAWAILGFAAALGSGWLGGWWAVKEVRAEVALRPPALVLDLATIVLARQLTAARQLAAGGFLVLDAQAVLAAPSELTVIAPGVAGETGR